MSGFWRTRTLKYLHLVKLSTVGTCQNLSDKAACCPGMICIMAVVWITREVENKCKTGIHWTQTTQLYNLDYADEICLLSQTLQNMPVKTNNLALIVETTGLRVGKEKTKVIRANKKQQDKIKLNGKDLEDVEMFTCLGSAVTVTSGAEKDVKTRLGKARLHSLQHASDQSGMPHRHLPKPNCASPLTKNVKDSKIRSSMNQRPGK